MWHRSFLGCFALFASCFVACNAGLWLVDREPSNLDLPWYQYKSTPIILVGTILENTEVGQPRHASWSKYAKVQLYRVTVHIEDVLRGGVEGREVPVYYFAQAGWMAGPARLGMAGRGGDWRIGDREMFFLRVDSGVLRTICDFMVACEIAVDSGEHPGFHFGDGKPLAESIVDLLLTRGQHCTDQQLEKAIVSSPAFQISQTYAEQKLQQLAATESPEVREEACETLALVSHSCVPHNANWESRYGMR